MYMEFIAIFILTFTLSILVPPVVVELNVTNDAGSRVPWRSGRGFEDGVGLPVCGID